MIATIPACRIASHSSGITVQGRALSTYAVAFIGKCMNAAGIDPPVVEVEESAHCNRQIDGVIVPTGGVQRMHVFARNARRVMIHFMNKTEQGFVLFIQRAGLQVAQYALHQFFVTQEFGRDRGV
jgi:hypothetical protein